MLMKKSELIKSLKEKVLIVHYLSVKLANRRC